MAFLRNVCEKCLNFMEVEKVGEDYHMRCPTCENPDDGEWNFDI